MKAILTGTIATVIAMTAAVGATAAQSCTPLGRISQIIANYRPSLNDGFVKRATGDLIPLAYKAQLFPGDRIVVSSPGLIVRYVTGAQEGYSIVDHTHPMASLPLFGASKACSRSLGPRTRLALEGDRPSIVQTITHDVEDRPVRYSTALPQGEQWLPASMSRIAPVWSGDAAEVRIDGRLVQMSGVQFVELARPSAPAFTLEVRGGRSGQAQWTVRIIDQTPPWPSDLTPSEETNDEDRL